MVDAVVLVALVTDVVVTELVAPEVAPVELVGAPPDVVGVAPATVLVTSAVSSVQPVVQTPHDARATIKASAAATPSGVGRAR